MNAKEFAQIAAAFAENPASVQSMAGGTPCTLSEGAVLISSYDYRLTPKPREWWVVLDRDGDCVSAPKNRSAAEEIAARQNPKGCYAPYAIVHVAEVLP